VTRRTALAAATLGAVALARAAGGTVGEVPPSVVWQLDSLAHIGGHAITVEGAPRLVQTEIGPAVEFNGESDGLFLDVNPLAGLRAFTVEILFNPDPDGQEEQRFLHFEEAHTGNRALIELRMLPAASWCLDTFLRSGEVGLTLIDRSARHPSSIWHVAALVYDGRNMAHYVNGVRETSGEIAFAPLGHGRTSIGVRQNRVSWFRGRISSIRITPDALPADRLLRVPSA
jgi:hypothetical protein